MSAAGSDRLLRVLHVGVSNRGAWPLENCNASTGFVSTALCDVTPAALAEARTKTGLPESACFSDFGKALAGSKVDCVIICAPTAFHVPLCKQAIDAHLPVLVEKGMAPNWEGAVELVRHVRDRNAICCIAQNYRYNRPERTIWRALHDEKFDAYVGPVHLVTYAQHRVRPIPRTLNYPFASVWDMSCHHFDNLMYWLGPIQQMSAFSFHAKWSAYEHDNNTAAHMVFENGTHVHYIHTHDAARSSLEIQLHGERGALVRQNDRMTFSLRPTEQFGTRPVTDVPLEPAGNEADLLRDFYRYIVDGTKPGISAQNNLATMAACEMMVRSITAGKAVHRRELSEQGS